MFKSSHMTMTEIGQLFDASSHKIGKWLIDIGLRTRDHLPSAEAFMGDFVRKTPIGNGYSNWLWHSERTVRALVEAGHRLIPNPPLYLVDPPTLSGPFQRQANQENGHDIVNGDGSVAIVVTGKRNADLLVNLLNLAHTHGVLARHFGTGRDVAEKESFEGRS